MPYGIFFDSLYYLESWVIPANAIVYLVAASALLNKLTSLVKTIRLTPEVSKTAFTAYKLVFATVLLECLALVVCLDGFKIQMGIMTWIIYMSALMILFMIFLTLTLDEFVYRPKTINNSKQKGIFLLSNNNSTSPTFTLAISFCFFIFFLLISFDFINLLVKADKLSALVGLGDMNSSLNIQQNLSSSDIFYTIAKDISSSHAEYILSGLVQAVCLISVILLIVFR